MLFFAFTFLSAPHNFDYVVNVFQTLKYNQTKREGEISMNIMRHPKRRFSLLLCVALLCICIPQSIIFADEAINDNGTHSFTGDTSPIVVEGGSPTIVLTNVTVNASDTPSIQIKSGASVTLQLNGNNTLNGGKGCAAICVEPSYDADDKLDAVGSAKLTITGSGNLTAIGGNGDGNVTDGIFGAGAGIGGNGQSADGTAGVDFGTIEFSKEFSGTVNAKGGQAKEPPADYTGNEIICFAGGGAGIGSGGFDCSEEYNWNTVCGIININGGTIKANEFLNDKYVGAGIGGGTGGLGWHSEYTDFSNITVTITGGTVTAQGGITSAGIGGGSLCDGGTVQISGGEVTAIAGDAESSIGASGIGGGSDAGIYKVNITGGTVKSSASGGAAGIGGGSNTTYSNVQNGDKDGKRTEGKIGIISISGNDTVVNAFGGTGEGYSGKYGGAGIGSGYPVANDAKSVAFDISITDGATVNAYGGYHSQAIGYGYRPTSSSYYRGYGIKLSLDDTVSLLAVNCDYFQPPIVADTIYDNTPITYESDDTYLTVYENAETDGVPITSGTASAYLDIRNMQASESFAWSYANENLTVDGNEIKTVKELSGNWATLYKKKTGALSVSKTVTGNAGDTTKDFIFTVTLGDNTISGTYGDMTFENGVAAFTLKHGETKSALHLPVDVTYTVVETEANQDGYTTTVIGDTGTIADGETATAEFTNAKSKSIGGGSSSSYGTLKIVKTDSADENIYLAGAKFEIYNSSNKLIGAYTTDKSGQITINKLTKGTYYAVETVAPNGYETDSEKHEFAVTARNKTTLHITNKKKDVQEDKPSVTPDGAASVPSMLNGDDHFAYIIGRDDGLAHPEAPITRAEVTTIFFRLLKPEVRDENLSSVNGFADVQEGDWYNAAVSTMYKPGIIKGRTETSFDPTAFITRAEFAAIAARFDQSAIAGAADFTDIVNHWAKDEIGKAAAHGWIKGYEDGTFKPDAAITRAEAMALINRILKRMPETADDLLGDMVKWTDNTDESKWYYLDIQEATNSHNYIRKNNGYETWTAITDVPEWMNYEK